MVQSEMLLLAMRFFYLFLNSSTSFGLVELRLFVFGVVCLRLSFS